MFPLSGVIGDFRGWRRQSPMIAPVISQQRQTMTDKPLFAAALLLAAMAFAGSRAAAADIKVLTAGAFKQIVVALAPEFEKQTGHQAHHRERDGRRAGEEDRGRRGVRRDVPVARRGRRPDQEGQDRGRQPGQHRPGRGRRDGQGGRAEAGRRHGRGVQAGGARRQDRSPISIRRAAARAASTSQSCSSSSASPTRSSPRPSSSRAAMSPT